MLHRQPPDAAASLDPTIVRLRPALIPRSVSGRANPLVQAAGEVLLLASQIRRHAAEADLDELHLHCIREMRDFQDLARHSGLPREQLMAASYALCMVIDEAVLGMPWSARTNWATRSMALTFHGEDSCAGELALFVEKAMARPHGCLTFLELLYICLSLGMQGGHPIKDAAARGLLEARYEVLRCIRSLRGDPDEELPQPHAGLEPEYGSDNE